MNKKSTIKETFPSSFELFTDCELCSDCDQELLKDYEAASYCLKCKKFFHFDCKKCTCDLMLHMNAMVVQQGDVKVSAPYVDKFTLQ